MAKRINVLDDLETRHPGFWKSPFVRFFTTVIMFWVFVLIGILNNSLIPIPDYDTVIDLEVLHIDVELQPATGHRPVIVYQELTAPRMVIDDKTKEVLLRVVEAEVTGEEWTHNGHECTRQEMLEAKIRVAQVFMNRVEDNGAFVKIDNLYDALTYKGASSTFIDGRYYKVTVSDLTREAVELALMGDTPDYTEGALFFCSGTTTCAYGDLIFVDEVGHAFFK